MGKLIPLTCGFIVKNLFTKDGISCDSLSTEQYITIPKTNISTRHFPQTHFSFTKHPHCLSPVFLALPPLMNTLFTQFPHPLLLLQRNKI